MTGSDATDHGFRSGGADLVDEVHPARPASVVQIRRRCRVVAHGLGASPACCDAVALAVSEAATNAVLYAYAPDDPGRVRLRIAAPADGRLTITVSDDGAGLGHAKRTGGIGKGLLIMQQVTASLRVVSRPGRGTAVEMTFPLA